MNEIYKKSRPQRNGPNPACWYSASWLQMLIQIDMWGQKVFQPQAGGTCVPWADLVHGPQLKSSGYLQTSLPGVWGCLEPLLQSCALVYRHLLEVCIFPNVWLPGQFRTRSRGHAALCSGRATHPRAEGLVSERYCSFFYIHQKTSFFYLLFTTSFLTDYT